MESPLVYACELWVFAMSPALRGSTVSYAGVAHFPKHSLGYSLDSSPRQAIIEGHLHMRLYDSLGPHISWGTIAHRDKFVRQ